MTSKASKKRVQCSHPTLDTRDTKRAKKEPEKPKTINDALMEKKKVRPVHSWRNIYTWGEPNKNGNYTRLLGKKRITIYKNKDDNWQYVYDGEYSTAYMSLEGILSASYSMLKDEILKYIPQ